MARDEQIVESYDRMPYASTLQPQSHPANLATLAFLRGIDTASPARCRVLELGCADGGNLLPIASELPDSSFLGIDLVPSQIEAGLQRVKDAGLTNVELRAMSLMDADASLGTFDFIICHGVYSWVDAPVREKILAICAENLAPNGIAYISYNTYPGWHSRQMVREMVQFHTRNVTDDAERVQQSVAFMRALSETTGSSHAYGVYLKGAREQMEALTSASYFVHEYLEATNEPCYFHEFTARAAEHGLQFVCEGDPDSGDAEHLPLAAFQNSIRDRIDAEQYVDYAINRSFRRSLLTHASASPRLDIERIRQLHIASSVKPMPQVDTFRNDRGRTYTIPSGPMKSTLEALAAAWPRSLSFAELEARVNASDLPRILDGLHANGAVELSLTPHEVVRGVSERPTVSSFTRWEARQGTSVTTLRHRVIGIQNDDAARFLLPQLDGTRDHAELLRMLDEEIAAGRIEMPRRFADARALLMYELRQAADVALLIA
ncbi:MAG TPA: class I SAM-dependent methyltransferase [Thermoanaerobaculia bacterium]|nr:class I SAM-dependent methyltransferase [Thermoanaerobaculia bacterium]